MSAIKIIQDFGIEYAKTLIKAHEHGHIGILVDIDELKLLMEGFTIGEKSMQAEIDALKMDRDFHRDLSAKRFGMIELTGKVIEIEERFCISFVVGEFTIEFALHDKEKHLGNFTSFNSCLKAIAILQRGCGSNAT